LATIEVYEEDKLIENAATLGKYLGEKLEDIKERHPSVGRCALYRLVLDH
jgi:4-aminobutyrate aminotransferase-like enzyme